MKLTRTLAVVALALVVIALPQAQVRAQRAEVVTLDVRALDIDHLLQFYSRTFGLTVVKDPNLSGPVTIMSPDPVSRAEALDILNSVLEVRGFTSVMRGNLLKIVPVAKAVQSNVGMTIGRLPAVEGDQVVTHLIPLRGADAVQLQTELTPLVTAGGSIIANSASNTLVVTDYASNIARLLQIVDQLDSANVGQVRVFQLTYAQATEVAQLLTQVFFSQPRAAAATPAGRQPEWQRRLMGALSAATGATRAGAGASGQAVADTRTNSVLVSASGDRMEQIAQVIQNLDRPVERQGNLTVVALERANAQDVATALSQALGGRATTQGATTAATAAARAAQQRTTAAAAPRTGTPTAPQGRGFANPEGEPSARSRAEEPTPAPAPPPAPVLEGIAEILAPLAAEPAVPQETQAGPEVLRAAQAASIIEFAGNVSVVAEPNTNALIITAPPEYALLLTQLIRELDQAPPQVLIKAIVAEVALDAQRKLGFEWTWTEARHFGREDLTGTIGTDLGLSRETLGLRYSIAGASLDTLLHALATDDRVTILSTPRIFTSNNRPAEINISTQTPYVASVRVTDATETFAVQYLDVGVILRVTPQIAPDGTVTMQVTQEANELLGFQEFGRSVQAPTVARRSAQATVRIADGQTVILGGIISENSSRSVKKVPLLGDLPLLGGLFRQSTTTNKRSELLVFLTPQVVRSPEEASALTRAEQAKSVVPLPVGPALTEAP